MTRNHHRDFFNMQTTMSRFVSSFADVNDEVEHFHESVNGKSVRLFCKSVVDLIEQPGFESESISQIGHAISSRNSDLENRINGMADRI